MNHRSLLLSCALCMAVTTMAQLVTDWGDQHNGTYKNPVLNADYSDPDVIRVDNKYYMVASDFHYLGMQVLESEDMVNWHLISQIYDRFELPGWDQNMHYGGGSWAPAIRWHEGRFYVYFCTPDEGLFMATATDAAGPWSPLHCVKAIAKWEDPCPFWDDDGQAYLGRSRHRAGPIIIHKMTADGRELLDDGVTVYTGPVAEGTKFLKRNGFYYIIIPEGGVGGGWQTVLRSKNIYGPYEKRVVLEQGSTHVNGPHQGALVDTPDGHWWFYHFQETHPLGRVVHLQPVSWRDDWPLMGVDIDGNGIGEPVAVWTAPYPSNRSSAHLPATSDEFTGDEHYWVGQRQRTLGLQWQWNHNPVDEAWSLTDKAGWLTLQAVPAANMMTCRNMMTQKTMGFESEAITKIDCSDLQDGDHTGLLCMGNRFMGIGILKEQGRCSLYLEHDGQCTVLQPLKHKMVYLKVTVDSQHNQHAFAVSTDGKRFSSAGEPFSLRMGSWKGARIGLYLYNNAGMTGGKARFDYFHYDILR